MEKFAEIQKQATMLQEINSVCGATLQSVANVFSSVMGEKVTPRQALCILHVCAALMGVFLSFAFPFVVRLLAIGWLYAALHIFSQHHLHR